ncbi:MAG: hypothetical protein RL070_643 [Bacteroidota bacterium]|jgi:hypothetical protein
MEINDDNILDQSDYREIIYYSLDPIHDSIGDYFFMKYNEHRSINHNFSIGLRKAITKLKKEFYQDIESKIKPNVILSKKMKWDDFNFYLIDNRLYYDFQLDSSYWQFPQPHTEKSLIKKRLTINKLAEGYEYFLSLINDPKMRGDNERIKLNWLLNNNQLYVLFQELRRVGAINNTAEQISIFLKENIATLSDTSKSTVLKEVSRKHNLPKSKRIRIEIGEHPKK